MMRVLDVFLDTHLVGKLRQNDAGKLSFRYVSEWLEYPGRVALSLSLPLRETTFNSKACSGFFSGLLPEGAVRDTIAQTFGISAKNHFSLLERIGGDCAGAVTFLSEGTLPQSTPYVYRALSEYDLGDILRRLPYTPLLAGETGMRLSLAGAQSKLSVCVDGDMISLPLDGAPSTHILKPPNSRFPDLVFNEAFCMQVAKKVGLSVATVVVKKVAGIDCLLITRYDRKWHASYGLKRVHQEDFCQALGIPSEIKYQAEGGPSLKKCFSLIRQYSFVPALDLMRFLDAVLYNFLIGNNDAHGKNFSFLYEWESDFSAAFFDPLSFATAPGYKLALAPLYDLVCTAYYEDLSSDMAMAIGGKYDSNSLSIHDFELLAEDIGFSKLAIRQHMLTLVKKVQEALDDTDFQDPIMTPIRHFVKKRCDFVSTFV